MVLHGEGDRLIPPDMGRRVYAAAPCPAAAIFVPGIGHVAFVNDHSGAARRGIVAFASSFAGEGARPACAGRAASLRAEVR